MNRAQKPRPTANAEFTDTVIWEELSNELSDYAGHDVDTAQTMEVSALLTDEETDSLLSGKRKPVTK